MGRRIAKKVNGVVVEKYLWQGLTRLLAVYDGGDNLLMRFEYADARMPIAVTKGGITYYLTYDQVGSLRSVTDASGNIVKRIDYDSSGSILSDTNPGFTIPFGFAGGLHDRDTGLVKFGFRDYDPNVGRWNAKDPILFAGRDVDFYVYVGNNPVNFIDPLGLYSWNDFMDDWSTVADIRAAQNYWQNYGGPAGSVMSGLLSFSGLATVQESGETLGDPCKSTGQKVWAGAKIVGVGASWYLAGSTQVTGQVAGQVRTSRIIGLRNKFGEHFFTDENGFFFALDRTFHRLHIGPWKTWFTK
ncbi:MAG: RHS repeat-associated core domain-containing protein [Nitrospirota bacterium]